eukprot:4154389-Amphidinium_carterae.2
MTKSLPILWFPFIAVQAASETSSLRTKEMVWDWQQQLEKDSMSVLHELQLPRQVACPRAGNVYQNKVLL